MDETSSQTSEPTTPRGDETSSRVPPVQSSAPPFPSLSARSGERNTPSPERWERQLHEGVGSGSPDFNGGVRFDDEECEREHIPVYERSPSRVPLITQIPPEDSMPKGCSLQSIEPLRNGSAKAQI